MSNSKPLGIVEFFWLSGAQRAAEKLSETARTDLRERLGLAHQRAEAAEALWMNGHAAEGLRLMRDAFDATLDVVEPFGASSRILAGAPAESKAPAPSPAAPTDVAETAAEEAVSDESADADEGSKAELEAKTDDAETEADHGVEAKADDAETEADDGAEAKADDAETKADDGAEAKADDAETEADGGAGAKADDEVEAKADDAKGRVDHAPSGTDGASARSADDAVVRAVLGARHLSKRAIDDVLTARRAIEAATLPRWDKDVTPDHHELFQDLSGARRAVARALDPAVMSKGDRRWIRLTRVGTVAVLALAGAVGSFFAFHKPDGIIPTASSNWSPSQHVPADAIDGDPHTEWHGGDNQTGWFEISIEPPQTIQTLRILNGHNPPYNDRAVRDATIEIYSDGDVASSFNQSWPRIDPDAEFVEFDVGGVEVEKIRVIVNRYHFHGAAIAEIAWE